MSEFANHIHLCSEQLQSQGGRSLGGVCLQPLPQAQVSLTHPAGYGNTPLTQQCALPLNIRHIREIPLQLSIVSRYQLTPRMLELTNLSRMRLYLEPILVCDLILDRLCKIGVGISL